jgi:protein-S-isoprenylcysteine O-methyltransferase Ste14
MNLDLLVLFFLAFTFYLPSLGLGWRRKDEEIIPSVKMLLSYGIFFVVALGLVFDNYNKVLANWPWLFVCFLGMALHYFALKALGRNYSPGISTRKGHELVEKGPYGAVRHPILFSVQVFYFGLLAIFYSNLLLLSYFVILLYIRYRFVREERVLAKNFGKKYLEYCKRVPAITPRLTGVSKLFS